MNIDDVIETFDFLGDWEERYKYLIDLGRKLPPLPESEKTEATLVRGCMSQVWMTGGVADGKLAVRGDSDAHLVRGLIALLLIMVNGKSPEAVLATDVAALFKQLGLDSHITVNRRNGFFSMVERIQQMARAGA